MIRVATEDGKPIFIAEIDRRVALYLDNDSLIALAKSDDAIKQEFLEAMCACGTLLFSGINAVEVGGSLGASSAAIRTFLDAIGPRWDQTRSYTVHRQYPRDAFTQSRGQILKSESN